MSNTKNVFHLAIPVKNLRETEDYYVNKLGCKLARKYSDRVTLNFFGEQVVCHLAPDKIDTNPQMYPRHFGITFKDKKDFDSLLKKAESKNLPFFKTRFSRFKDMPEEHLSFLLIDPSNNLLEFKYYFNSEMMY